MSAQESNQQRYAILSMVSWPTTRGYSELTSSKTFHN